MTSMDVPPAEEPRLEVKEPPVVATPAGATAELMGLDGSVRFGTVTFAQRGTVVTVTADFVGLPPGLHGFSVHQGGDCGGKLAANAGGHFNPGNTRHGSIGSASRHVGDFGNLSVEKDGVASFDMTTDSLTVEAGPDSVVGRTIIIHARRDDGKRQPSGSGGAAVACGVIGAVNQLATSEAK